jgi:hypothetical protein
MGRLGFKKVANNFSEFKYLMDVEVWFQILVSPVKRLDEGGS